MEFGSVQDPELLFLLWVKVKLECSFRQKSILSKGVWDLDRSLRGPAIFPSSDLCRQSGIEFWRKKNRRPSHHWPPRRQTPQAHWHGNPYSRRTSAVSRRWCCLYSERGRNCWQCGGCRSEGQGRGLPAWRRACLRRGGCCLWARRWSAGTGPGQGTGWPWARAWCCTGRCGLCPPACRWPCCRYRSGPPRGWSTAMALKAWPLQRSRPSCGACPSRRGRLGHLLQGATSPWGRERGTGLRRSTRGRRGISRTFIMVDRQHRPGGHTGSGGVASF
jgi:hypothetical protein